MSALRNWKLKGMIQKTLAAFPGGGVVNDALQHIGELRDFDGHLAMKVEDFGLLMSYLAKAGADDVRGKHIMEIGSGWHPAFPMCFALVGVGRCHTVDVDRHMSGDLALRMVRELERHLPSIAALSKDGVEATRARYDALRAAGTVDQLLERAGIVYHAPADASRATWLADGEADMVYSNCVLEHIPPPVLAAIMKESHRVLKPDGVIAHAVACNDHYANTDKSISYVNYLQYSDAEWRLWTNRLNYQNRLRASDFIRITQEHGFEVVFEVRAVRPGCNEALAKLRVAPEFSSYQPDDLVATTVDFVARKKSSTAGRGQ